MEDKDKRTIYYRLLIISAIIIPVIIGFSYAYFLAVVKIKDDKPTVIQGTAVNDMYLSLETENDGYINAGNMIPLTTDQIEEYAEVGTFKVTTGNNPYKINYTISLTDISLPTELKNEYFKWKLICTSCTDTTHNAEGTFSSVNSTEMELKADILIDSLSEDEYKLMIWLQESGSDQLETMNKTFKAKVKIEGEFVNTESAFSAYQEIEYIESTGTQWISTDYYPSNTTGFYIDFKTGNPINDINPAPLGAEISPSNAWGLIIGKIEENRELLISDYNINGRGHLGGWTFTNTYAVDNTRYKVLYNYKNSNMVSINNTEYALANPSKRLIPNKTINIFNANYSNTQFTGKIYKVTLTEKKIIIYNFIPAKRKSDNIVGLYDTVEQKFYTNADASGDNFVAGPNI